MWEQLIETALVGTDKKPLDRQRLPEAIQEALEKLPHQDAEAQFFQATALATYYLEAGAKPALFRGQPDFSVIEETAQEADPGMIAGLSVIEGAEQSHKNYLLNLWLDGLISKQWIVSSGLIMRLITLATPLAVSTRQKVYQVIGRKGQWALSFKKDHGFEPETQAIIWQEGTTPQRRMLLERLLSTDLHQALQCLQATWAEESITTKRDFLSLIVARPSEILLDFVQDLYENEWVYKPKEKKTERECRHLAAMMLLRMPTSRLFRSTTQALESYFSARKRTGILSLGAARRVFQLPAESDDFWNATHMLEAYGLDTDYDIGLFTSDRLYWLGEFLEHVPLHWWASYFSKGYDELFAFFLEETIYQTKISGKQVPIYMTSLVMNVISGKESDGAAGLIRRASREHALSLVRQLTMPAYEAFIIKSELTVDYSYLENSPEGTWSLAFCKESVIQAYKLLEQNNYYALSYLGAAMTRYATPEAELLLDHYHEQAKSLSYFKTWDKSYYSPIKTSFYIKNLINSFK